MHRDGRWVDRSSLKDTGQHLVTKSVHPPFKNPAFGARAASAAFVPSPIDPKQFFRGLRDVCQRRLCYSQRHFVLVHGREVDLARIVRSSAAGLTVFSRRNAARTSSTSNKTLPPILMYGIARAAVWARSQRSEGRASSANKATRRPGAATSFRSELTGFSVIIQSLGACQNASRCVRIHPFSP